MVARYAGQALQIDDIAATDLAARYGTPLYVMSQRFMLEQARRLEAALRGPTPHLACYAVKANPTLAVIQTFARAGLGADVTSGGELYRALRAGVPGEQIVFSGVGKTRDELVAALDAGVMATQVESLDEVRMLDQIAEERRQIAAVGVRVNPEIDPHTHPGIATGQAGSKFGIAWDMIQEAISTIQASPHLRLRGLSAHAGSQITEIGVFEQVAEKLAGLAREVVGEGGDLDYVNFGGGLAVCYQDERVPKVEEWAGALRRAMGDLRLRLVVEPGRWLVAEAGVLLARVVAVKQNVDKHVVVVDAGMNDLLRPALYGSYHPIWPAERDDSQPEIVADIAGPVCESSDVVGRERTIRRPRQGDVLAILCAGAYGSSMGSNYNSRRRPAEVLIRADGVVRVIRDRETYGDLVRGEKLLDKAESVEEEQRSAARDG